MQNKFKIGRDNPLPLYYQLKMQIIKQIEDRELVEGQALPSEHDFQKEYGISRATVRQALTELENEGLLERRQGIGTFVSHKKIAPEINKLTSFTEDMLSRGFQPGSVVLHYTKRIPPQAAQEHLNIPAGDPIWFVARLRLADNEPMGIQYLYIPPYLDFKSDDLAGMVSYYKLLEDKFGLKVVRGHETLTAKNASQREAELLQTEPGCSLLYIQRTSFEEQDRPVEYVEFLYRADRYQYQLALYR